jgi:hypothetical protein
VTLLPQSRLRVRATAVEKRETAGKANLREREPLQGDENAGAAPNEAARDEQAPL